MNETVGLGREALRGALDVRRRGQVAVSEPVCVYDLAESLGVEVKFVTANSLGGMFAKTANTILVPSLRPSGRRAFTCAHELGHWYFEHGDRIDELTIEEADCNSPREEQLADLFASHLLMPKWAVNAAISQRNWDARHLTAHRAYILACQMGVGYETILRHMWRTLHMISQPQAEALLKKTPKQIRREIIGSDTPDHIVITDMAWTAVPIDLQVGEKAIVPDTVISDSSHVRMIAALDSGLLLEARRPGITRLTTGDGSWSAFVRISRREFTGRSIYRHLEDSDVD